MSKLLDRRSTLRSHERGFTLVEIMLAMAIGLVVIGVAAQVFHRSVELGGTLEMRAEMQQNARGAMNSLSHDIVLAGTGLPSGGIALPVGPGTLPGVFGCEMSGICYVVNNQFATNRLFYVNPGSLKGPNRDDGFATDVITVAYRDPTISFVVGPAALNNDISASGDSAALASVSDQNGNPIALNDPAVGVTAGDAMVLSNVNGAAVGIVTDVQPGGMRLSFSDGDILHFNQSAASAGNIASIANTGGGYPTTQIARLKLITYFLFPQADGTKTLMRQEAAHAAVAVAEGLERLTFSFDIFDDVAGAATSNLADPAGSYNSIRKVNIGLQLRSVRQSPAVRQREALSLATSVSPRSLSFRDRYQ